MSGRRLVDQVCIGCSCTDSFACQGGCSWWADVPPICSACIERLPRADVRRVTAAVRALGKTMERLEVVNLVRGLLSHAEASAS